MVLHQAPCVSRGQSLYPACGSSTEGHMRKDGTVPDLDPRIARTIQGVEKATLAWRGPGDPPGAVN